MDVRKLIATAERIEGEQGLAPVEPSQPAYVDEEDPSVNALWVVKDRGSLDWAMQRLAVLTAEKKSIDEQKEAAIARVEVRAAKLSSAIDRGVAFFEMRVAEYALANRGLLLGGGKKKSANLLHGRVGWRAKEEKLRVKDAKELAAWLERQPPESGLFRTKVEPEMAALQENFLATGEIPPGMEIDPAEDVFYVKPTAPELEE